MRLLVHVFLILPWVGVSAQEPPEGWLVATPEALSSEPLRSNSATSYVRAEADFDGDGQSDQAAIFLASDGTREGLFVMLSSVDQENWHLAAVTAHRNPSYVPRMGISVAQPGSYVTACGKGYWECKPGEPPELQLNGQGVFYFIFESGRSIVYWDPADEAFVRVWTSS